MDAKKLYKRVCATLEVDVRRLWGRIREAEEKSCGVGTISRFYNGTRDITLEPLLDFLCAVGIDPAAFFARALGRPLDAEALLGYLIVEHRNGDRVWRDVEKATLQLERDGDLVRQDDVAKTQDVYTLVADIAMASRREQMRRLRTTERCRNAPFARAYLKNLDALRLDEPELTYRLSARVAIHLIPAIPGSLKERVELQCEALGVFGSAARLQTKFATAAQAFFLAIQLADRHDLLVTKGRLLHRTAHLLENTGNASLALIALREALEIYVHADSAIGLAKTLVVQGRIFCCIEEFGKAIRVLKRAILRLPENRVDLASYQFTAFQSLAFAYHHLGADQDARRALARASDFVRDGERVRPASLKWQEGGMSLATGNPGRAQALLQSSRRSFRGQAHFVQEALVSIDLVRSLFLQGKHAEACETASSAARFLEPLKGNSLAEAAIVELTRAGNGGRLNLRLLSGVRQGLERARPEARAR